MQPINQTVNSGSNATITIASSDSNAHFQWQLMAGATFQDVLDTGIFSGASTNNLLLTNINISNNNDSFRCIVSIGTCTDTSNTAILSVINTTDLPESNFNESIRAYPIPASEKLLIESKQVFVSESYSIVDLSGSREHGFSGKPHFPRNTIFGDERPFARLTATSLVE